MFWFLFLMRWKSSQISKLSVVRAIAHLRVVRMNSHGVCSQFELVFFLMPWTNFGSSRMLNVVVKFQPSPVCNFGEEDLSVYRLTHCDWWTPCDANTSPELCSRWAEMTMHFFHIWYVYAIIFGHEIGQMILGFKPSSNWTHFISEFWQLFK